MKEFFLQTIHRIRWRFSYPYRIRRGLGLTAVRDEKELKAVVDFCRDQLKDKEMMDLNPDRKRVYEMTVLLYEQGLSDNREEYAKCHTFEPTATVNIYNDVEEFINDHLGWYWD